jgi:UDPglucose 6-dehydrogenase
MSLISAEVAKVGLNAYITMKISFANTLANICEAIPGTDVDAITGAIGVDRRISPHYLKGGLAYGGTCFPRDTRAFVAIAEQCGVEAELMRATEQVNARQHAHLAGVVLDRLGDDRRVSILGVAFKADTPVVEASPAMSLIQTLVDAGVAVTVYDPLALEAARAVFADAIGYATSAEECLASAPVSVVTLEAAEYRRAAEGFAPAGPLIIIDCWRMLDLAALHARVTCVGLGRAPQG